MRTKWDDVNRVFIGATGAEQARRKGQGLLSPAPPPPPSPTSGQLCCFGGSGHRELQGQVPAHKAIRARAAVGSEQNRWVNYNTLCGCVCIYMVRGFPGGTSGKEPAYRCCRHKRCGFEPWVGKIPWRRARQPTPLLFPGESQGQRSLVGYSAWGDKESDTTEVT